MAVAASDYGYYSYPYYHHDSDGMKAANVIPNTIYMERERDRKRKEIRFFIKK